MDRDVHIETEIIDVHCGPSFRGGRVSLRGEVPQPSHELRPAREEFSAQRFACSTRKGHRRHGVMGERLSLEPHPLFQ